MQGQSSSSSPVSPITPSPSDRPHQRFFTTIPTAHNYLPPPKFPPHTSSLCGGIQQPIQTYQIPTHIQPELRYPEEISTFTPPRPWNTPPSHNEYSTSISSTKPSPTRYPSPSFSPSPPLLRPAALSSLPLRITTILTAPLSIHLGRRQSRCRKTKKLSKRMPKSGSSTHLPRNEPPFPNYNNPYNYQYWFNSSPALTPLPWGSEEEIYEEITPNPSSTHGSRSYISKHLGRHESDRSIYGRVVSGEGTFIPRRSVVQGSSSAASPVSSIPMQQNPQHQTRNGILELLLVLFQKHNTIVRIVRWLRREDLCSLTMVSKQVREGILLPPTGLGFDQHVEKKTLLENITRVTDGDNTHDESDGSYQISPLSPLSPLKIKVGSVVIPHSLGIADGVGAYEGHPGSKTSSGVHLPSRPWNESGEFMTTDHAFGDDTSLPPDPALEAAYSERLGRLVWLLTLTARCKTPHRQQQGKEKLRLCIWCGDFVCADCDISPYIPHSHRLRRLCFDCWRLSGNGALDTGDSPTLGSSTSLASSPTSPGKAAKARNLLCTCKQGDEWICPDCDTGGRPLELDEFEDLAQSTDAEGGLLTAHASSNCRCWVCGKELGGGISKWDTPAQGGMGYAGIKDIWRLCMWCGKRMMVRRG